MGIILPLHKKRHKRMRELFDVQNEFRKGSSTQDYIFKIQQITETARREKRICLAFLNLDRHWITAPEKWCGTI